MCYFPFDRKTLDSLDASVRDEAELAVNTAEKMCEYYQYYARSLYNKNDAVHDVNFTREEAALTSEIIKRKNAFRVPKTRQGKATLKLFYASQMHFYIKYPHMIDPLFGPYAKNLMLSMQFLKASPSKTFAPVDEYFADAADKAAKFVLDREQQQNNDRRGLAGPSPQ